MAAAKMTQSQMVKELGAAVGVASHILFFRLHQAYDPGTLDGQLAWMKSELHLSDAQFDRMTEEDLLRGLEGMAPPPEPEDEGE